MQTHEHKQMLAEMLARRIANLQYKLSQNPKNKLLREHIEKMIQYYKNNF